MQSKNQPTAAQKRWREAIRALGSVISGGPAVIHHAIGHTGRHNKELIGPYWLVPLTDEEHKALHRGEKPWLENPRFKHCETRKEFEKEAYAVCRRNLTMKTEWPPQEVGEAIKAYHK